MKRWEVVADLVAGASIGAELGVWKGQTFYYLLDHLPDLKLIGVDSWPTSEVSWQKDMALGISTWYPPAEIHGHRNRVLGKLAAYGERARILEMDTVAAADLVEDGSLDFVFIDADHSTEGVLRDIEAWQPKLHEAGLLIGHDEQWPSVQRALTEALGGWHRHADNVWTA